MSLLRPLGTVLVAASYLLLLSACFRAFMKTGAPDALGMVIVNALFVFLYVTRSSPKSVSESPLEWALSFTGTTMSLLLRPSQGGFGSVGIAVQCVGLVLIVAALLSLRRSFGIVPANRGVREGGLYRFVRHPLYAAELVFVTGFMLANLTVWNVLVWACACVLQVCRARVEERFLDADPQYRSYRQRTPYRLVPLVF